MQSARTLEFDRIVEAVTELALTPLGSASLSELEPSSDPKVVVAAQAATSETVRFLERHPLFPLRAGEALPEALAELDVQGRPLEPLQLRMVADFVDSVDQARAGIGRAGDDFPILRELVSKVDGVQDEVAAVRDAIDPGGDVLDGASPELKRIRNELRQKRQKLRGTLEQYTRGSAVEVPAGRSHHRAQRPLCVDGARRTSRQRARHRPRLVDDRRDAVHGARRHRRDQQRHRRARGSRARRDFPHPARADGPFPARPADMSISRDVARELDVLQAKARYSSKVNGIEPEFTIDTSLQLKAARHPMLETGRADGRAPRSAEPGAADHRAEHGRQDRRAQDGGTLRADGASGPARPRHDGALPVFRSVFADIGDEQSIEASLSTFSAHIRNLVSMDRDLQIPALVLLDEVGTGTDPNEGGALATAIVQHFRQRGAHIIATTHFDAVKTWGIGTDGVTVAAFAFDPQNFAPTYKLLYGAPGRSLAIEMAQRLGMPLSVIAAARGFLSDDQKRLQAHLSRLDAQARALEAIASSSNASAAHSTRRMPNFRSARSRLPSAKTSSRSD